MSRWRDRIRISGGFWLLAAWFTLVNGWQLLAVILSAAALHELGHLLVLRLLGARVRELRVSVFGAELMTSAARLSYPGEIAAVLAGPAVNLLCALVLGGAHAWVAAGAHLSLCLFNLLPVRPLDGGRALYLAAAWLAGPSAADRIACWAGGTTALALGGGIRVGLEDTGFYAKGILADNEMLVQRAARIVKEFGCEPATPDEARAMLKIAR